MLDPIVWYVVFVISVTVHEAAHATVAYLGGDPTAYKGGQVSLNPVPHMRREPIGMLVVPLLTAISNGWPIGWASAPYDPRWEQQHPRRAAWMAAAGPGANLALALLALIGLKIGLATGAFYAPDSVGMAQLVAAGSLGEVQMQLVGAELIEFPVDVNLASDHVLEERRFVIREVEAECAVAFDADRRCFGFRLALVGRHLWFSRGRRQRQLALSGRTL